MLFTSLTYTAQEADMFADKSPIFEYAVTFEMKQFYRNWDVDAPDAEHDMLISVNALVSAGIKPFRVVLHPKGGFSFIFLSWREAIDCHMITARVIDLLWLID
jgi:hypothetical protein